jgi:hypothetical protein
MTNEEKDAIEGRVRRTLREAKRSLAALRIEVEEYAQKLETAAGSLRHFLSNPIGAGPTGMTGRQYAIHFFSGLIPVDIERKLAEFETTSAQVLDLESKVKDFE